MSTAGTRFKWALNGTSYIRVFGIYTWQWKKMGTRELLCCWQMKSFGQLSFHRDSISVNTNRSGVAKYQLHGFLRSVSSRIFSEKLILKTEILNDQADRPFRKKNRCQCSSRKSERLRVISPLTLPLAQVHHCIETTNKTASSCE